jgi:arsenate reductase (glutaredoxin)
MALNLQIFGTKKCSGTRHAERFFKERRVPFQLVDIAAKGPSPGELRKIASAVGGIEALIDRDSRRYVDRGLKYAAPTGPRIEQALIDDPLLLRTPIVLAQVGSAERSQSAGGFGDPARVPKTISRAGPRATVGVHPEVWAGWLAQT